MWISLIQQIRASIGMSRWWGCGICRGISVSGKSKKVPLKRIQNHGRWAYLRKPAISFQSLLQSPDTFARPGLAKRAKWSPHLNYSSYVFLTGWQHIILVDCHGKGPQKASFGLCMKDRNFSRPACFVRGNSCGEMVQESKVIQSSD